MPSPEVDIESLRDEVEREGTVKLYVGTDVEFEEEAVDGMTVRGLFRKTGAIERIESLMERQREKGKTVEGTIVHVRSNGTTKKYDSIESALDVALQPDAVVKVSFKIGTNL